MGQKWGQQNGPPYPLSRLPLGEQMRIRKKRRLQAQNAKIRKRNAELRKKNKEKEENRLLKERQRELKDEQKALKSGKLPSSKKSEEMVVKETPKKPIKTMPLSKRDIRSMTDEEIRANIDRRKLEQELWKIDNEVVTSGGREVKKMLGNIGKKTLESIATTAATNLGKMAVANIISNVTGDEDLGNEIMGRKSKDKSKSQEIVIKSPGGGNNQKKSNKSSNKQNNQSNQSNRNKPPKPQKPQNSNQDDEIRLTINTNDDDDDDEKKKRE
jgi:hypothetical protein